MTTTSPILVTGGTGFIATHIIAELLRRGHRVRATARSVDREPALRAQLSTLGVEPADALTVAVADLTRDEGWTAALAGVEYVMHVASPLHLDAVADEDDVIRPAREGTLRVLRAARDAGVRRVVLTSAFHAVGFGWGHADHVFTDDDWAKLDGPGIDAYGKSKTLAERAAWDFMAAEGGAMELVVLNPVAVMGPVTEDRVSGGNALIRRIVTGDLRAFPDLWLPIVDVRDVAVAHANALDAPDAAGHRFIIGTGAGMTLAQIATTLRARLGARAPKIGRRRIPTIVVRLLARFRPELRWVAADAGYVKRIDGTRGQQVLGWRSRPTAETVGDTGQSLLALGVR